MLSFFPLDVFGEIWDVIESLSEGLLYYSFSFARAAVACAILERTSGLGPSSKTTAPRYLMLVTVPSFCTFIFISLCTIGAVCHQFCLLGTDLYLQPCAGFVETVC